MAVARFLAFGAAFFVSVTSLGAPSIDVTQIKRVSPPQRFGWLRRQVFATLRDPQMGGHAFVAAFTPIGMRFAKAGFLSDCGLCNIGFAFRLNHGSSWSAVEQMNDLTEVQPGRTIFSGSCAHPSLRSFFSRTRRYDETTTDAYRWAELNPGSKVVGTRAGFYRFAVEETSGGIFPPNAIAYQRFTYRELISGEPEVLLDNIVPVKRALGVYYMAPAWTTPRFIKPVSRPERLFGPEYQILDKVNGPKDFVWIRGTRR